MLNKKIRSFKYAYDGVMTAWREEFNFRVDVVLVVVVLFLSWYFQISTTEFLFVVFAFALVLSAEIFNTALEELCDKFHKDPDPHIGKIKDLAAGAVALAALGALVIGCIIFIPKILALA